MADQFLGISGIDANTIRLAVPMPLPKSIFFVKPDYFTVDHGINPHMLDEFGQPNQVDYAKAQQQWQHLVDVYRSLDLDCKIFTPKQDCPDMVFCANQSFPFLDRQGRGAVILSNMENDCRQTEVESIGSSLEGEGFPLYRLPMRQSHSLFEGMGDALWVPGRKFLLGGFGFRTHQDIYRYIHEIIDAPIVLFQLTHPRFYHLDTCLSILDEHTVLACEEAFRAEDWLLLQSLFTRVLKVPLEEADSPGFACNAHCPDTKHVIIQAGNQETERQLREAQFIPIAVDTSEFVKSGGSVFCMKQVLFPSL